MVLGSHTKLLLKIRGVRFIVPFAFLVFYDVETDMSFDVIFSSIVGKTFFDPGSAGIINIVLDRAKGNGKLS